MKFLDVKTDYAFKKVFGTKENKPLLIKFLNSVIYFNKNHKIKDLTIIDPYNIPQIKGVKESYVDVKALLDDDTTVIIEMQVLHHKAFDKRVLYNMAKNYSMQLHRSEDYHLLNPIISLNIVDFTMFDEFDKVISNFKLLEKEKFVNYSDDIELVFIELPKYKKELKDLDNLQDKFIYFIKHAGRLDMIPKELEDIKEALTTVNEAGMSQDELEAQYKRREFLYVQKSSIELALETGMERGIEKGMEQGIEKGIEKGKLEEQKAIAISLLDILDDKTISQKVGLSLKEVEKLREENS
jgi:predicted transposase/invertase (TIGR01784 family)